MQTGTWCVKCYAHYAAVTKLVPNIWFWSVVFRVICTIYSMFFLWVAFKHSILCMLVELTQHFPGLHSTFQIDFITSLSSHIVALSSWCPSFSLPLFSSCTATDYVVYSGNTAIQDNVKGLGAVVVEGVALGVCVFWCVCIILWVASWHLGSDFIKLDGCLRQLWWQDLSQLILCPSWINNGLIPWWLTLILNERLYTLL